MIVAILLVVSGLYAQADLSARVSALETRSELVKEYTDKLLALAEVQIAANTADHKEMQKKIDAALRDIIEKRGPIESRLATLERKQAELDGTVKAFGAGVVLLQLALVIWSRMVFHPIIKKVHKDDQS